MAQRLKASIYGLAVFTELTNPVLILNKT